MLKSLAKSRQGVRIQPGDFIRRLLLIPVTFVCITFLIYTVLRVTPGGPIEQARLRIAEINPGVEFVAHPADVRSMGREVFDGCGVVLDCLDSYPARRALAEQCAAAGLTLIHGAVAGWSGQVAVIPPGSDLTALTIRSRFSDSL